jgi:hypothetical protein
LFRNLLDLPSDQESRMSADIKTVKGKT